MSVNDTDIWQSPDANPLLWMSTGGLALVAHLALLQLGISTYQSQLNVPNTPSSPTMIIATALQVAGKETPPPPQASPPPEPPATVETLEAIPLQPSKVISATITPNTVTLPATSVSPTAKLAPTNAPQIVNSPSAIVATTTRPTLTKPTPLAPAITKPVPEITPLNQPGVAPIPTATVTPPPAAEIEASKPVESLQTATVSTPLASAPIPEAPAEDPTPPAPAPTPLPDLASSLPPQPSDVTEDQPGVASANAPTQTTQEAQQTYNVVLDFLRGYDGGPCFSALPVLAENGAFQFETFANSRGDLNRFRNGLEKETGTLPGTVMKPVSDAQCQALPFVTAAARYPEFQIYFDLPVRNISSGEVLSGKLGNTSGGFVSLLLIDDEGVVQDLGSFLKFRPGFAGFDIPMTLKGSPVETHQLLMALSTRARLKTLKSLSGQQAEDFFQKLSIEILQQGGGEDVALVAFSVH